MSSVTFLTFGDSFLPLEIFFRFFQIILHCKLPEYEKIWKKIQGAKMIHQRFFLEINVARFAHKNETFLVVFKHCEEAQALL